ncbi:nitrous oxide reductase family maturation protein NosD [Neisseria sp. N95_16]|uniref:Nitrous oxide reductase family maturation protein NosD n=1 Tax=Neisseria brasiliensis TaxID=2666100 RepID=A0A5Q3RW08_9NEIS|nr:MULTISPECIES: nitrous oxide reductase family maturation protein NosD [Neisseria]MRN37450.1 nitrous oxide reductase family maturation protein NosD [Neisseria brasiliensis]PJO08915.1 nitrous oxide reductase family maturation protein NosD [Neisseria sp. N95_16]PJO77235.1 nitrous oxide reductase family maturation protein NosD [Neisseria sp. N177_16]QGL24447.1 nitrous oxide reductase family maturation protein NosD [Neisseria brasiliensis]
MHTLFHVKTLQYAVCALLTAVGFQTAFAAVIAVSPTDNLNQIIAQAQAGDTLKLASGVYQTKIIIDKPLTLEGPADRSATIQGDRQGRTVSVHAPDVVIRHLTVSGSGMSLPDMDAGIYLEETATNALVEKNDILDNSVGVYLHGPKDAMVRDNKIVGNAELRVNERGNGVTVWNAPGSQVVGNDISKGRDGIFSNASTFNIYKGNRFHDVRFAVHYMYTNDSEVIDNISIGNNIAYAMMFSDRIKVRGNIAVMSRDQGIMLNYVNQSEVQDNVIYQADKCLFAYNANNNKIFGNHFEQCKIGIHFTAAIEGTELTDNSFINNESQVKYVSTRFLDWSEDGRGNYWSDNSAFDLDGDGFGDSAYRPNGITDQIIWRAPVARLLMNSPAVSIVKWAQSQFPAIMPGGVVDSKPLMKPYQNPTMPYYLQHKAEMLQAAKQTKSAWAAQANE